MTADMAANAALGKNTKSAAALSPQATEKAARSTRYALLNTMSAVLGREHRVSVCQRVKNYSAQQAGTSPGISVNAAGRAHFHGVGSCGDVWACPVCSHRISGERRAEVVEAMRQNRDAGGVCLLVTWTFSHHAGDDLGANIRGFCKALSWMKSLRHYKQIMSDIEKIGEIRALEITHRWANGWHPHAHEVWYLKSAPAAKKLAGLQSELFALWAKACRKHEIGAPTAERGVTVEYREADGGEAAGAYVAKWGMELTFANRKTGKLDSRSPWQILKDCHAARQAWKSTGSLPDGPERQELRASIKKRIQRDADLLREYAAAVKGRAQLFWSRGLKDQYGIADMADAEIADKPEIVRIATLSPDHWAAICNTRSHADVLHVAETDPMYLGEMLDGILERARARTAPTRRAKTHQKVRAYVRQCLDMEPPKPIPAAEFNTTNPWG